MSTTEFTAEIAHAAVKRGAAWLDKKCPEWPSEINLALFDLADPDCCMLGQTAECIVPQSVSDRRPQRTADGGYWRVLDALGINGFGSWPREHGFDVPHGLGLGLSETEMYAMLTIAWREIIRERLGVPA